MRQGCTSPPEVPHCIQMREYSIVEENAISTMLLAMW